MQKKRRLALAPPFYCKLEISDFKVGRKMETGPPSLRFGATGRMPVLRGVADAVSSPLRDGGVSRIFMRVGAGRKYGDRRDACPTVLAGG
jgi:hypothetical protein